MKNTFSKIIYLFIFSFFLFPSFSFAEIYKQTDYSTSAQITTTNQALGNGLDGVVESFTWAVNKNNSNSTTYYPVIFCFTDSNYSTACSNYDGNWSAGGTYTYISLDTIADTTSGIHEVYLVPNDTVDLQPSYYYALNIRHWSGDSGWQTLGSASDVWGGVNEYLSNGQYAMGTPNAYVSDYYFKIDTDTYDTPDDTSTRIVWNEPTTGTSTPSRTIDVDFDYYIGSISSTTYDRIHIDFCSLGYPDDDCERLVEYPLTFDVYTNVATSTTLNRDGYYLGLIYFTDGVSRVYGSQSVKFNSATTTLVADIPLLNPVSMCDSLDGTFDTAICKSMLFLFYPSDTAINRFNSISNIFEDKIPFGYYYSFKNKLENFSLSSTTAPVLSFDFGENGSTAISGTMTIFDLDDIDTNFDFSLAWTWIIRFMWITFGVYVIARTLQVASVI